MPVYHERFLSEEKKLKGPNPSLCLSLILHHFTPFPEITPLNMANTRVLYSKELDFLNKLVSISNISKLHVQEHYNFNCVVITFYVIHEF